MVHSRHRSGVDHILHLGIVAAAANHVHTEIGKKVIANGIDALLVVVTPNEGIGEVEMDQHACIIAITIRGGVVDDSNDSCRRGGVGRAEDIRGLGGMDGRGRLPAW